MFRVTTNRYYLVFPDHSDGSSIANINGVSRPPIRVTIDDRSRPAKRRRDENEEEPARQYGQSAARQSVTIDAYLSPDLRTKMRSTRSQSIPVEALVFEFDSDVAFGQVEQYVENYVRRKFDLAAMSSILVDDEEQRDKTETLGDVLRSNPEAEIELRLDAPLEDVFGQVSLGGGPANGPSRKRGRFSSPSRAVFQTFSST